MNIRIHGKGSRGFTIAEVTMAVGIVAFGLVAVFSILPFGLTAQKDNREETIIRYEAQYWFAALQSGGLPLEEMARVERVELTDANATVRRINTYDPGRFPDWQVNVCGWLSAPDDVVKKKFARVWAFNGSLFERLSPGEFSFNYFMETHVEPIGDLGSRITLTFHWPISGPIEAALNSGSHIDDIVNGPVAGLPPPANQKSFSILTSLRPRKMSFKAIGELNNRQKQFLRAGLPGQKVSIRDLELSDYFKTREGKQKVNIPRDNRPATVNIPGAFSDKDIGRHIEIRDVNTVKKSYPILGVKNIGAGHEIQLDFRENPPIEPNGGSFEYRVTFLDKHPKNPEDTETWKELLKEWEGEGLGTVDSEQWMYGFVSPSGDSNSSSWILK